MYTLLFILGRRTYYADFGVLPELLELALMAEGSDGIIGSQLILDRPALLASRRGKLELGGEAIEFGSCIHDGELH